MNIECAKFILVDNEKVYFGTEEIVAFLNLKEPTTHNLHNLKDSLYTTPFPYSTVDYYREFQITCKFINGTIRNATETLTQQQWKLLERFKKSITDELKTSEEWSKLYAFKILDPDGWDRKSYERFNYSWYEELITREEFHCRAMRSTVEMRTWMDEND